MGLIDKLKAGAEQAKDLAGEAAARAKEEARELQLKRDLRQAYSDLGEEAFELLEQGELTHPSLESRARRVRTVKGELDQLGKDEEGAAEGSGAGAAEPGAEPGGEPPDKPAS